MDKDDPNEIDYIGIEPRFHEFRVQPSTSSLPPTLGNAFLPLSSIAHYCEIARTRLIGRTFSKSDHGLAALQHAYTPGQGFVLKSQNIRRVALQNVTGQLFKVRTSLVNIGTSSISLEHELIGTKNNDLIARDSVTMILIDFGKKKTASLPDKVKDLLAPLLKPQTFNPTKPIPFSTSYVSQKINSNNKEELIEVFNRGFMVLLSDLDMLGHTNHGSYVKWAEDTKWLAAREEGGFKSPLLRTLCTHPIHSCDAIYISETFFSQLIECSIWPLFQQDLNPHTEKQTNDLTPIGLGVQVTPKDSNKLLWNGIITLAQAPAKL